MGVLDFHDERVELCLATEQVHDGLDGVLVAAPRVELFPDGIGIDDADQGPQDGFGAGQLIA